MKVKIEQVFKDKYTGEIYKIGDVITVDKARGDELLADNRKLVSLVEDEPVKEAPKAKSRKK